jgi:tetratricopeptide (TPR) repeat protein
VNRQDFSDLGPPPDSRGQGQDALSNLRAPVRRRLDEAGRHEAMGDFGRAQAGYTEMIASSDPQTRAAGSIALGLMFMHRLNLIGATKAYRPAINSSDPDLAPLALLYTGQAWQAIGDLSTAMEAFYAAAKTRHPNHAPPAAYYLGKLGAMTGMDAPLPIELLLWVVDSKHPGVWPLAAVEVAKIAHADSFDDAALEFLRRALDSDHPEAKLKAAQLITSILQE